jgi:hypothetical protein
VTYRDDIHGMVKSAHPHRLPNGDLVGMAADFSPFLDRDSTPSRLVGGGSWQQRQQQPGLLRRRGWDAGGLLRLRRLSARCWDTAGCQHPNPSTAPSASGAASHMQRLPEITVYRQSPWQSDRRLKVASVPYMRPTAPTWIHEARGWGNGRACAAIAVR